MKWIKALNLQQWADSIPAKVIFPALVADLIRATANNITEIRFPNGDKGQVRGYDGVLKAEGEGAYVPDGDSFWEFGVNEKLLDKVNSDYEKRTREVVPEIRLKTTFVFASLRTWDNPKVKLEDWLQEKRSSGKWKDIKLIDGTMLEDWLSACPAVAAYYARYHLELMPQVGVRSIKEFWDEYSTKFNPPLTEAVLLAGREKQKERFLNHLRENGRKISLAADSPDEVIAFAIAAIRTTEVELRHSFQSRALIIDTDDAARQLSGKKGMIFLPRDRARFLAGLLQQSSITVVSAGADETRTDHEILSRPDSISLGKALESMGFDSDKSYQMARQCGRSLSVLARQISSCTAELPEWKDNSELLPALLAGAWSTCSEKDKSILKQLGGYADYSQVENPLRPLIRRRDSPIDRVDDIWSLRSSVDAFIHLGYLLGEEHLGRFEMAVRDVFSYIPTPPKSEDLFVPDNDIKTSYSSWLRNGMATILLHMAILHEQAEFRVTGMSPQDFVNKIVQSIPGLANDYRLFVSLRDQLPLLAEAAPDPFFNALEQLLKGNGEIIAPIFNEDKGLLAPQSHYHGLKWALEALAWEQTYLLRAATCLAKLAVIDPGGTYSDRPINSLRTIFLAWSPNTWAPVKVRNAVIKKIITIVPGIGWSLLQNLLPRSHDTSDQNSKMKFRESTKDIEKLTWGVVWEGQTFVIQEAILLAGTQPERWKILISHMSSFPENVMNETFVHLKNCLDKQTENERFSVWEALRHEYSRHKKYSDANWSFKYEVMEKIKRILEIYQPNDLVKAGLWIFNDWANDIEESILNVDGEFSTVEDMQIGKLREIYSSLRLEGVLNLFQQVNNIYIAARHIPALSLSEDESIDLFVLLINSDKNIDAAGGVLINDGVERFGIKWLNKINAYFEQIGIAPDRAGKILASLRDSQMIWGAIEEFGYEINKSYWLQKQPFAVKGEASDLLLIIDKYISWERGFSAIISASQRLSDVPSVTLLALLDIVVKEINNQEIQFDSMMSFYIKKVFDELQKRSDVSENVLAFKEMIYLPCFSDRDEPFILHRLMMKQPEVFIEAICIVYRSDKDKQREPSELEVKRATSVYRLLEKIQIIPGQEENNIDQKMLEDWCVSVRHLAKLHHRQDITDYVIGKILAHAPKSSIDNAWPHEAIRHIVETLSSDELEKGIQIGLYNKRGVFTRMLYEGGQQEKKLAEQYREWASSMPHCVRTSAMLFRVADEWEYSAKRADIQAAKRDLN